MYRRNVHPLLVIRVVSVDISIRIVDKTLNFFLANLPKQSKGTDNQQPLLLNDQLDSVEIDEENETAADLAFQLEVLKKTIVDSHL